MRKFLLRLCLFATVMVACDLAIGVVCGRLVENAGGGGDTMRKRLISNEIEPEIAVFGSSRAIHHYDPDILGNTLGMTTYNCGFDGNGIICAYGYERMMSQRHTPSLIVYDVAPGFDLLVNDNHTYLGQLRYFYGRNGVDSIFLDVDKTERYKMKSRMYRYNSMLPQLVMDNLHPMHSDTKGYRPLDGGGKPNVPKPNGGKDGYEIDSLKLRYLDKMVDDCRRQGTEIVFTVSPLYTNNDDAILSPIRSLCERHGVPLISHYTDTAFNDHGEYFNDGSHLNRLGATEYSRTIAYEIKSLYGEHKAAFTTNRNDIRP